METPLKHDHARVQGRPACLAQALARAVPAAPDAPLLTLGDSRLSRSQVEALVRRTAAALTDAGLRPDARALVLRGAGAAWLLADLAVQVAGGVTVLADGPVPGARLAGAHVDVVVRVGPDAPAVPAALAGVAVLELDRVDGPLWGAAVERHAAAPAAAPDGAAGHGEARADDLASVLLVAAPDGRVGEHEHEHAAWTYQGAVLVATDAVRTGDVVLVDDADPSVLRSWWSAALQAGATLVPRPAGSDPVAAARSVGAHVVVPGPRETAALESRILGRSGEDRPWGRGPARALEALAQVVELQRQGRRVTSVARRRAAAAAALVHPFGDQLRLLVLDGGAPPELRRLLDLLQVPVLDDPLTIGYLAPDVDPDVPEHGDVDGGADAEIEDTGSETADHVPGDETDPPTPAAAPFESFLDKVLAQQGLSAVPERLAPGVVLPAAPAGSVEAPGGTTRPARGFDLNSSALSQLEARMSETSDAPAANPAQPQPEAAEAPDAPDTDLPVRAREAIGETADVLVGAGADFRDLALEQRVRRMCPPVDLVLVTPAGGAGRLALVSMDATRLAAWARDAGLPGSDHAEWAASQECRGYIGACLQSINEYLLLPDRVQQFTVLEQPLTGDAEHDRPDRTIEVLIRRLTETSGVA